MRAVVVRHFGGPEVLEVADLPEPGIEAHQLLVKVAAAPVTPVDLDIRSGELASILTNRPYYALGRTAAGTVAQVGSDVTSYAVGDVVIGVCGALSADFAAQAELVVFDEDAVALAPTNVSLAASSALPLNGLTADQALAALDLAPGDSVLITGAAGSVGGFAVELAKSRGLRVVATARDADEELVLGLGADHFVPSTTDLAETLRDLAPAGVDGVVDAAVLGDAAAAALRDGGRFVTLVIGGEPAAVRGITVSLVWARPDAARLGELVSLVEGGVLRPRVAAEYPLSEAAAAHERLARGRVRGQLVLVP